MFSSLQNNLRPWQLAGLLLFALLTTTLLLWLLARPSTTPPKPEPLALQNTSRLTAPPRNSLPNRHSAKASRLASPNPSDQALLHSENADEDAYQAYTIILHNEEDYQRLKDWAAANGFRIIGELPRLFALHFELTPSEYRRIHHDSGIDLTEEEEILIYTPDQLLDKYPEWTGNPGPAFGANYRYYLGVDTTNTERGQGVTIAMLDTPLFRHSALDNANITPIALRDDAGGSTSEHGTAVASILTGTNGISNANILAYSVLDGEDGTGSAFDLANAIVDAVDRGADIISMSLASYSDSILLQNAVQYALEKQVILVAAAGNNGVEEVCYPAAYDGVLAVGAIDANGNVSGFSNYGEEITLVAPGVGLQAASFDDEYAFFSGTSAAVPCVSAVLANYMAANPSATTEDTLVALLQNCNDTEDPGYDALSGFGILDAERMDSITETGITDAAAAGITLEDNTLTVSAQNTGTETLSQILLTTQINGVSITNAFEDVAPGTVVSAQGTLPEEVWQDTDYLMVRTTVTTPNINDARPRNQTHTQVFGVQ